MTTTKITKSFAWASCLALAGCLGGSPDGAADDAIDTSPASLKEAQAARDSVDALSGLVDRLDVAPNHTINFFVTREGTTLVGERMQKGMTSALAGADSIDAIYQRLAPGRTVPAALANVSLVPAGDVAAEVQGQAAGGERLSPSGTQTAPDGTTVVRSALTTSAADDTFFRNSFCTSVGVWTDCVIDWTGGRSVWATSDHSITTTAFTAGTGQINLKLSGSSGAVWQTAILPGEVQTWWTVGPTIEVSTCGGTGACQSNYNAKRVFIRWDVLNAAGKVFDFADRHYNDPTHWNRP